MISAIRSSTADFSAMESANAKRPSHITSWLFREDSDSMFVCSIVEAMFDTEKEEMRSYRNK